MKPLWLNINPREPNMGKNEKWLSFKQYRSYWANSLSTRTRGINACLCKYKVQTSDSEVCPQTTTTTTIPTMTTILTTMTHENSKLQRFWIQKNKRDTNTINDLIQLFGPIQNITDNLVTIYFVQFPIALLLCL